MRMTHLMKKILLLHQHRVLIRMTVIIHLNLILYLKFNILENNGSIGGDDDTLSKLENAIGDAETDVIKTFLI